MTYFKIQSTNQDKKITKFLKSAQGELGKFFGIELKLPTVFFLNSREQIDQIWQKKTEDWLVGWTANNNIFILDPKVYTKESDHKDIKSFWGVLKHEYAHIAMMNVCWHNKLPKWLSEGLACYLAGQIKKQPDKKTALRVFDYFQKSDRWIYGIGFFWVNLLIKKFGKRKMLELLKSINYLTTKGQFAQKFYQIYKIHFSKEDLLKLIS